MSHHKWVSLTLTESSIRGLLEGKTFSKCRNGIQVFLRKGSDEREKVLEQIELLKKKLENIDKKSGSSTVVRRRRQTLKQCPLCTKQVRGLKLHLNMSHGTVSNNTVPVEV